MAWSYDVPAGVSFTCSQCGECCFGLRIALAPGEPERLAALEWAGIADDLVGVTTFEASPDDAARGPQVLRQREDGSCVYLGARRQCRIHESFGGAVKPHVCRSYPFGFRRHGDRVHVDVAFSCRSVSDGTGAPAASHAAEWAQLLSESGAPESAAPRLTRSQSPSLDVARDVEGRLLAFLDDASLPLEARVRCALGFLTLATTGDASTPAAAALREAVARGLPARVLREPHVTGMDATQRAVFRQWLYLALNPMPPQWERLPERERDAKQRSWQHAGIAFRDGLGRPSIDGAAIGASFADVEAVDAAYLRGGCEPLATFLRAKIVGERFLAAGLRELSVVEGARVLLLCHPMACWTAKAVAAARRSAAVEEVDVRAATRLLDRTLGRLATSLLAKKQAKAFDWVIHDTDLIPSAMHSVLG